MKIILLDGQVKNYEQPKSVLDIAGDIAISLKKKCVGAIINDKDVLTNTALIDKDCKLELITDRHDLYKSVINYTARIITVFALKQIYPDAEIVPQSDDLSNDEFSVYFDYPKGMKFEELKSVEEKANKMIAEKTDFVFGKYSEEEFPELIRKINIKKEYQDYVKKECESRYIKYEIGNYKDDLFFARHALLKNTGSLFKIELTQLTGAYFLGDSSKPMIYKLHGLAAQSKEDFEVLKTRYEDQRNNDHKFIAKNLEIYHLDPIIGQGLPIWLPNGTILKQEIKKYLMQKEFEYDFIQIETPVIGTSDLYKRSGHWDHYREDMFSPMQLPKEEMVLKPMSCPHHISVYNYKQRSYRELPLRFAEHALQHRYESSGSLTGLERVRAMELTDSHIFVRPDQVKEEFIRCFNLIQEVLSTFDIKIDYLSLSLRDPNDKHKYFNDDKMWNEAEEQLEQVLKELKLDYKKMIGEAAFYGPKLDIQAKTALGHEITVSTIQLDFLLPQKFELAYVGPNRELLRPIMIHRGLVGTYERFISVLLEQTKGVLPLWCTPRQVEIIPVQNNGNNEYSEKIRKELKKHGIRAEIDKRDERLSYRVRDAQIRKIPFQLVLGEKEEKENLITYRKYSSEESVTIKLEDFIKLLKQIIDDKVYV
ncbi:threonine--tRNA ligase [Spiroplasma tabanidicola]|uniref:Threonine--tRNA ligase n=1 Tax=Spiroplasma tabanidicola TaxID=324079 RepID=A0A6I6C778_9MOLU|nr:threonine--tRNA ligase [Spiroplasma tabanidicola]QGS51656.1 threonyl-tRNA synthetase [Spiroplasma tabanidicola]